MTNSIAEMDWMQYRARLEADPVVFLAIGSLEQHGPHLPMCCDELIPRALAEAVAARIGGLVAPSISYGYKSQPRSGGGNHFVGTTSLDAATLIAVTKDVVLELMRHGVTRLVLMDGHYENTMLINEAADLACREAPARGLRMPRILRIPYYEYTSPALIDEIWGDSFPGWPMEHGGMMETCLMLHIRPDLVHLEALPDQATPVLPVYDVFPVSAETWPDIPPSGIFVPAHAATAEKGARLFNEYVDRIAADLRTAFRL